MSKSKIVQSTLTADNSMNGLNIQFYISDAASANTPRIIVNVVATGESIIYTKDRPLSDYSDLSGAQKTSLKNLLIAIRDQFLTLEGFS